MLRLRSIPRELVVAALLCSCCIAVINGAPQRRHCYGFLFHAPHSEKVGFSRPDGISSIGEAVRGASSTAVAVVYVLHRSSVSGSAHAPQDAYLGVCSLPS